MKYGSGTQTDVSAPFPSALLVVESQGVHHLVLHGAVAADAAAARLVVDGLRASYATDVRGASPSWKMNLFGIMI